jgi:hypothetical protein
MITSPALTGATTTDEAWSIAGTSLHQYGWNVTTFGGSRYELPPRRGDNIKINNRPGTRFRPKLADSHQISLLMWVDGIEPSTGDAPADQVTRFNDSWDFLRRLLWTVEGQQFILTRRWKLSVSGTPTIVAADAIGELAGTMAPTMTNRTRADFQMDILLADPYFYGQEQDSPLIYANGAPVTINNPGYDVAAYGNFSFDINGISGPLTNPKLYNSTLNCWMRYNGTIPDGGTLTFDVPSYTVTPVNIASASTFVVDYLRNISHYGRPYWLGLTRGSNTLQLTADSGTGTAVIRYQPPYL